MPSTCLASGDPTAPNDGKSLVFGALVDHFDLFFPSCAVLTLKYLTGMAFKCLSKEKSSKASRALSRACVAPACKDSRMATGTLSRSDMRFELALGLRPLQYGKRSTPQ